MNIFKLAKAAKKAKKLYNKLLKKEQELGSQIEKEENEAIKQELINVQSQARGDIQRLAFSHSQIMEERKKIVNNPVRNSEPLKKQKAAQHPPV